MSATREARFEQIATGVAALLLAFAGYALWHSNRAPAPPRVREVRVAWRCVDDKETCAAASDVERCTTCHEPEQHKRRPILIDAHASIGCVACHGGDGLALGRDAAHDGFAKLGSDAEPSEVQARCAACHTETHAAEPSRAKAAWAKWIATRDGTPAPPQPAPREDTELAPQLVSGRALFRSMRCGACHAARDSSPLATPLEVLALRGTPSQLARSLEKHGDRGTIDLKLDDVGTVAVAARLVAIESADAATAMQHRAGVAGSSADEGHTLYERLACAACHTPGASDDGRLHVDIANVGSWRTPDWVAFYLSDPANANPSTAMPSLRLSAREASSLAQHVVRGRLASDPIDAQATTGRNESVACRVPGSEPKTMSREACGEAIIAAGRCGACHAIAFAKTAPSLARFGEGRGATAVSLKLVDHAGYRLSPRVKRDLVTYLLSQREIRVRPDLRVAPREGEAAFSSLGCAGCHALDDLDARLAGPSLYGEGLKTRPQWLFELLRAPQRHPVRPSLHPEWAYRDLVPADHVTPRMPTFALDEATTTSLVRFFASRDGAPYPYAAVPQVALAGDALTTAVADVTRACLGCHTIATPDVARARESEGKLAPALSLAHDRLRPAWVEAVLAQPDAWVIGMPALNKPISEIDHVRDLVLAVRERTVLPPPGAEGRIPVLGLGDLP